MNSNFFGVFIRDPLERVKSACLDRKLIDLYNRCPLCKKNEKIKNSIQLYAKNFKQTDINYCLPVVTLILDTLLFENDYNYLHIDRHWLPQNLFCDLYKWHSKYHIYNHNDFQDRKKIFDDLTPFYRCKIWEKY